MSLAHQVELIQVIFNLAMLLLAYNWGGRTGHREGRKAERPEMDARIQGVLDRIEDYQATRRSI